MICDIVQTQLDDFLDGELKPAQALEVQSHLESCVDCQKVWLNDLHMRQLLKAQVVPEMSADFETRAFEKLPMHKKSSNRQSFINGFAGAMAAGVVLLIAAAIFLQPTNIANTHANIQLTLHQSKKVNMVFEVPDAVAEATFIMQVPNHIEIAGQAGLHQIEWKTALKKGKNLLSLPIVAKMAKQGQLVAKIKYGNQEKEFRMTLDIATLQQGVVNLPITKMSS